MELILLQDVKKLGVKNDIVKVKNGYGRNHLIPKGFAIIANDTNRRTLVENIKVGDYREKKRLQDSDVIIDILKNTTITIKAKVGKEDKIFGSVTSADLAEAIQAQTKIELDKSAISIDEEVKHTGEHLSKIVISKEFTLEMKFEVISDAPEPVEEVVQPKPKKKKAAKPTNEGDDSTSEDASSTEESPDADKSDDSSDEKSETTDEQSSPDDETANTDENKDADSEDNEKDS